MARCPSCGRQPKRSSVANRAYWLLLHCMADKLKPDGKAYAASAYHIYYRQRFLGCDEFDMPNGQTMTIPRSTANLDADEFSDYLAKVEADAAERGVYLDELAA